MSRPWRRLSITSLFTLATLGPLVLVGVLLIGLAVRTIHRSSATLGKDILDQTSRRVDADVRAYLEHTRRTSDLLAGLISDEVLSTDSYESWTNRFFIRLRTTPEISSICFTNEALDTIYLMRYPPELEYGIGKGHGDGSIMRTYEAHLDGSMSPEPRKVYEYDPRTHEWWKLGYESREPRWTSPYQWFQSEQRKEESVVAVAYTRTLRNHKGDRLGVLSVDATLDQIDRHLAEITSLPGAFVVVTDEQERVVVSSLKESRGRLQPFNTHLQSPSPLERNAAELLGMARAQDGTVARVKREGQVYWVRRVPLVIENGPRWTMNLAVPDDQLLQGAKQAVTWMIWAGGISLSAAVLFATLLARTVTRPMTKLAAFAREIGGGQFDRRVDAASTREFVELSHALNTMASNLQERVQLLAQKDAAQEASALKGRLIAHVSHEFRTPLNAIIGYGEILREAAHAQGQAEVGNDVGKILLASRHLLTLINNLLDLSRVEAGRMKLDVGRFSVRTLLNDVADLLRPVIAASGNEFALNCDLVDDQMISDPARVRQVLINLLGNAAKFTSKGTIRLWVEETHSQQIVFHVDDTGPGLLPEQLDRLFEPFGQADLSNRLHGAGAGLGLAICRQLCELLGGTIELHSSVGRGTQAVVSLPRSHRGSKEFSLH